LNEVALVFGGKSELLGVLSEPTAEPRQESRPAFLLLNAGTVGRVGPNRLYVKLARSLAARGFPVLRFDFSGVGDSPPRADHLPLDESTVDEVREAVDLLEERGTADRFVLLGICSGGYFALRAACADTRVSGLAMINCSGPLEVTDREIARTLVRHYRRIALHSSFRAKTLRKLLTLDFDRRGVLEAVRTQWTSARPSAGATRPAALDLEADVRTVCRRGVRTLFIHSEGDVGLDYMQLYLGAAIRELSGSGSLQFEVLPRANHVFTLTAHQAQLVESVGRWAVSLVREDV